VQTSNSSSGSPSGPPLRVLFIHDAAIDVIAAIDAKDGNKVFELGEKIEEACENCHKQYWYPNEVIPPVPQDTK